MPFLHFCRSSYTVLLPSFFPIKFLLIKESPTVDGRVLQLFHVLLNFLVSNFRIKLCGLDAHMPHHPGNRLDRDAQ